jgi:hypothetical protein
MAKQDTRWGLHATLLISPLSPNHQQSLKLALSPAVA